MTEWGPEPTLLGSSFRQHLPLEKLWHPVLHCPGLSYASKDARHPWSLACCTPGVVITTPLSPHFQTHPPGRGWCNLHCKAPNQPLFSARPPPQVQSGPGGPRVDLVLPVEQQNPCPLGRDRGHCLPCGGCPSQTKEREPRGRSFSFVVTQIGFEFSAT